jgi:hypothetical protein
VIVVRDCLVSKLVLQSYRLLLLAHTVQNLSLKPSSGFALSFEGPPSDAFCSSTVLVLAVPASWLLSSVSGGGGGGGGGTGLLRGSEAIVIWEYGIRVASRCANVACFKTSQVHADNHGKRFNRFPRADHLTQYAYQTNGQGSFARSYLSSETLVGYREHRPCYCSLRYECMLVGLNSCRGRAGV